MADIFGTNDSDVLIGTSDADVIRGLGGNDSIDGGAGNDTIEGGDGDDQLIDGLGDDLVDGGDGDDLLSTQEGGNDLLRGGAGRDEIYIIRETAGVAETITAYGGAGNDGVLLYSFNPGTTLIDLGEGDDILVLYQIVGNSARATLGLGSDQIVLDYDSNIATAVTVTDFGSGDGGDMFLADGFFEEQLVGWDPNSNPFTGGFMRLIADGGAVRLEIDEDGAAGASFGFRSFLVLEGLSVGQLTAYNFDGYAPDGAIVGRTINGSDADDDLRGSMGADVISGGAGNDQIDGMSGNDIMYGGAGRDYLDGGRGNDWLSGGADDDTIDGRDGWDVAFLNAASRQAEIDPSYSLAIIDSADGSDWFFDVEEVRFIDATYVKSYDSFGAQVYRMFDTVLDRAPDTIGLDFWVDQLENGLGLTQLANSFADSPEFRQATGGLDNGAFVDYVYRTALGREADGAGHAYWVSQLDQGLSRGAFLVGTSESEEHRERTNAAVEPGYIQSDDNAQGVALLYDSAVARLPEVSGLAFWTNELNSGNQTLTQVAAEFARSGEFQAAISGKSNAALVDYMYQTTLDRPADADGRAFWVNQLDGGLTQAQLLFSFSQSAEHAALLAPQIIGGIDVIG
ncbi:DUF4214 domain-containing protein [Sphingomonas sp. HMP9]|uniref:DUF4214 domain-containing protein n=1 Tax=Sphingomonas sp. HMP9 TaxID=1517554 RepID=UPI00159641A4|nr:DUF4214 domain-containing protein [Sphingomonas sp. HMP9]